MGFLAVILGSILCTSNLFIGGVEKPNIREIITCLYLNRQFLKEMGSKNLERSEGEKEAIK